MGSKIENIYFFGLFLFQKVLKDQLNPIIVFLVFYLHVKRKGVFFPQYLS